MKKLTLIALLISVMTTLSFADIRRPDEPKPTPKTPAKGIEMPMKITLDRNATEARLTIPRSKLRALRAEIDELEGIDDDRNASLGSTRIQTIVSGAFMSLALVFGGFWFVRSRKDSSKAGKGVVVGALILAVASFTTAVFANIAPPSTLRSITSRIFSDEVKGFQQVNGKVRLDVSRTGDTIELIVPDQPE